MKDDSIMHAAEWPAKTEGINTIIFTYNQHQMQKSDQ